MADTPLTAHAHRRGTSMMLAGTMVAVGAAFLLQIIGGRALGADGFAPVSVMWTLLFIGLTTFMLPVEQLVIRRVVLARGGPRPLAGAVPVIVAVIGGSAVLGAGFVMAFAGVLLDGNLAYVPVAAALLLGHGVLAIGRGFLAGSHRYFTYGVVTSLDALAKLVGAVVVIALGMGPLAFTWALATSPLVVFLVRPFRRGVDEGAVVAEVPPDAARRFMTGFLVSSAASQTVLAAGPWVVGALGAASAQVSIFFVTTTLLRGPMSASYNLLARILPVMTARAASGQDAELDRWARRLLTAGLAGAAVVGGIAAVVGPPVVAAFFGSEFRPEPWLAGLAGGAVIAGMFGLGTTQILVARGHTDRMAAVWLAAVVVAALAIAVAPGEPSLRVAIGFCAGEVFALVGLTVAAIRR